MKYSALYSIVFVCTILAGAALFSACESQLEASIDDITVHAKNAVDVLPADPIFVGMLNTQDLKKNDHTDLFGTHGVVRPDLPQEVLSRFEDFVEITGFDPVDDLSEVYMAVEEPAGADEPSVSVVAYASIDPERFKSYVTDRVGDELAQRTYRGVDVFEVSGEDHSPAVSFLNDEMVVAASNSRALENMIDRLQGDHEALNANDAMMNLVARASAGKSGWFIAEKPNGAEMDEHGSSDIDGTAGQIWAALDRVVVAMNVEASGLDNQVFLFPDSRVSAEDLSSLTRGLVAALKANSDLDAEQLELLDNIEVEESRDHVRIEFYVDNDMIEMVRG